MSSTDTNELLSRYARHGDEQAFTELVREYAPLLYRVAMRRLGDAHMAEEASQNVFIRMARKAQALAGRAGLAGWLHRAAMLEASSMARAQRRREARHHEAARLHEIENAAVPDVSGPCLDEALAALPAADRAVLLGRYYDDLDYAELGSRTGKSAEAAKKQTQRALARLNDLLARRGAAVPAAGLAILMGTEFSRAAVPHALAASLAQSTAAALARDAGGASLLAQFLTLMSTTKATLTGAALLVLLLATTGWRSQTTSELRRELAARQASPDKSTALATDRGRGAGPLGKRAASDKSLEAAALPDPLDAQSLIHAWARSNGPLPWLYDPGPMLDDANTILDRMSKEQLMDLLAQIDAYQGSPSVRQRVYEMVLGEYFSQRDPAAALPMAVAHRCADTWLEGAMRRWAATDAEGAWRWFAGERSAGKLLRTRAGGRDPEDALLTGFADGSAAKDIGAAVTFAREHITDDGAAALVTGAARALMGQGDHAQVLALASSLTKPEDQRAVLVACARCAFNDNPVKTANNLRPLLDHPDFPAAERTPVLRATAMAAPDHNVWEGFTAMHDLSAPAERDANLTWLAQQMLKERPGDVSGYVIYAEKAGQARLDTALADTARALSAAGDTRNAAEFARKIRDEPQRTAIMDAIKINPPAK